MGFYSPVFCMQANPAKKSLLQKQIPTILGLTVLVVALVAGIFFLGEGPGVFAPRATPQTTPKNIKLTNVTDSGFTVSFLTDEATAGFVKYGESANEIKSQASHDNDQLSGTVGQHQVHHITVRGLKPGTTYFYTLGTGSRGTFDNNGTPFQVVTAKRGGAPSAAKTAYGSVVTQAGIPAEGSIVYVAIDGIGEMSSLVKSSNSWAIPLSNARTADGSSYAAVSDSDIMSVKVQGASAAQVTEFTIPVSDSQPVPTITLGQQLDTSSMVRELPESEDAMEGKEQVGSILNQPTLDPIQPDIDGGETSEGSELGSSLLSGRSSSASGEIAEGGAASLDSLLSGLGGESSSSTQSTAAAPQYIDLEETEEQVITTGTPIITGKAAPNVRVFIEVNSETQIQQELISDGNGGFTLDIEALKQQLEPGEHTATYSYTDPATGQVVTKTVSFIVEEPADTSSQVAQTTTSSSTYASPSPSPTPYGSGNPYPLASSSPSPTPATGGLTGGTGSTGSTSTKGSTRSAVPSTSSAVPVSGSVGTTLALFLGGFFFITAGVWSYWLAKELS